MWTTIQSIHADHPQFVEVSRELLESSTRKIILVTTIICTALILAIGLIKSGSISIEILAVFVTLGLVSLASYLLLPHWMLAAQLTWLVGLNGVITLALVSFRMKEIAFLYALIPLMAVSIIGWLSSIGFGLLAIGIMAAINAWQGGNFLPNTYMIMVIFAQVLTGFIGWSAVSPLLTILEWTNFSYRMARDHLEELRDQRLGFKQVQEDLVLANKELVRLTNSLKVMTERAEEARRVKEEFVANVSHELRTPLNMIIGYTNLIISSPDSYGKRIPARLLADIASIQRNSDHLVSLINDVLDLSQVDAGRLALTRQWTQVREIISSAVLAVQPLFQSKKLYLETDLTDDDLQIYCDGTRIREVILNLLSNAGRFTDHGGVIIRARREENDLVVSVCDTGPGIAPADQQRIFEPFQQLDTLLHHRTGGSGLGLSISKRFVEMHDGKMWIESVMDRGTCLFFSIPIKSRSEILGGGSAASRWVNPYTEHSFDLRNRPFNAPRPEWIPRFLIVEQEDALARLFSRYLDGVEFNSVQTVSEALVEIEHSPTQAIIVNEPGTASAFKELPAIPGETLLISCWIPGRDESAHQLGVVHYLLKPVEPGRLVAALDEIDPGELSILMVDDDIETLQLFARIISVSRPSSGVIRATNGLEALQLMRERKPDVVLLDLFLPELDGFKVLEEKARDSTISSIPVIVVSSTDPAGIPIVSNEFSVHRSTGMSVKEFLDCLLVVSESLNSSPSKPRLALKGNAPA